MQPRLNHQQQTQRYAFAFGVSLVALICMVLSVTLSLFPDVAAIAGSAVVAIAWLALGGLALSIAIPTVLAFGIRPKLAAAVTLPNGLDSDRFKSQARKPDTPPPRKSPR
jgi:hypothetical protein